MYAVIRRYRSADLDETLHRADHLYADCVERQVGFCDYRIVRTAPDEAVSLLLFETRDEADRNQTFTEEFTGVGLAGLDVAVLDEWRGPVEVGRASEQALRRLPAAGSPG